MTASSNDHFDQTVIRDFTVSRQMLDSLRGVLPACHVCGNPSAYRDFDGRWSHQICAGESSKEKRDAKFAARGGKIAPDAGESDLSDLVVIMREAEESALAERRTEARPAKSPAARKSPAVAKSPVEYMAERAALMAHIRSTQPRPARRSPELISRMSERDVYDLSRIRTDPTNPDALRGELIDRARRANDLAHYPTAGRDQERVQDHIDDLLRRSDSEQWNGAEVARRILATGSEAYRRAFVKIIVSQIRMNSGPILTPEETQALKIVNEIRAMGQATGTVGGFAVPYTLDGTITATSAGSRNPFRQICRVETISGSNEWRQATSGAMTAAYAAEVAVSSDNSQP